MELVCQSCCYLRTLQHTSFSRLLSVGQGSLSSLDLRRSSKGHFQVGVARSLSVRRLSPSFPLLKVWETSVDMMEPLAVLVSTWKGIGIESLRTAVSYAEAKPRDQETVTAACPCTF